MIALPLILAGNEEVMRRRGLATHDGGEDGGAVRGAAAGEACLREGAGR